MEELSSDTGDSVTLDGTVLGGESVMLHVVTLQVDDCGCCGDEVSVSQDGCVWFSTGVS